MSKTGHYVFIDGVLVKVSDKPRIPSKVLWPAHNDPRTNGFISEHMDHKPVEISTKRQLRYELESRGLKQKDA